MKRKSIIHFIKRSISNTTILLCCLCLLSVESKAQLKSIWQQWKPKEITFDNRYLDYSKWSFHLNNVLYAPAYAKKLEGVYDIEPRPMYGINFGTTYTFQREKKVSYYIGFDIDYIPFYYFYYDIPLIEFPIGTPDVGYTYDKDINAHSVLTVPIGISYKTSLLNSYSPNLHFVFKGDIRFHFIQPGDMSLTVRRGEVWYFHVYGETIDLNILSPTLNFSGGINWLTKLAIININLNIQKGIIPYLRGEYSFFNLQKSPDTKGIYKVRADYIGVDFGITPKKWRKKDSKKMELNH